MNIAAQEEAKKTQSWLGSLPNGWEIKRLKYISTINDETLPENTDPDYEMLYVDIGSVDATEGIQKKEPMIFEAAPSRARRIVRDGDTIVSTVRTYLRAVAAIRNPEENLIVSTGFAVVRPKNIDPNYLAYCLRSSYFIETVVSRSVGVSYPATNPTDVSCIELPLPSVDEQQAIARFLDAKTAQIDVLMAQKRQLIDKLKEKRQVLIARTVTRGLPPKAAKAAGLEPHPQMKDPGVDWLGPVPQAWAVVPLKWRARCSSGDGIATEEVEINESIVASIPVVGGNGLMGYGANSNVDRQVLVIGRVGALCGNVHIIDPPAWITDNALVLGPKPGVFDNRYLAHVLRFRNLNDIAAKTAQPLITGTQVRDQRIPCPSVQEQGLIADFLDSECLKLDGLSAATEAAISRLTEYRQALITSAVTGKIDVRGLV